MKYLLITILLVSQAFASLEQIELFEADFSQSITDDKDKVLVYNGHVIASKPQNAKWSYKKPIKKDVYINKSEVIIVEPDIEQVIVRKVESKFDFFRMISNAKEIKKNMYVAKYKDSKFTIVQSDNLIESISYIEEFENNVKIVFKNKDESVYEVDRLPLMVKLLHTNKDTEHQYQNTGIIGAALETFQTILFLKNN